jgi:hypothetical protein
MFPYCAPSIFASLLSLLFLTLSPLFAQEITIITAENKVFNARKISIDKRQVLKFIDAGGKHNMIDCYDISEIVISTFNSLPPESSQDVVITLINHNKIYGRIIDKATDGVALKTSSFGRIKVQFSDILTIVILQNQKLLAQQRPKDLNADMILYKNGDTDKGVIKSISPSGLVYKSDIVDIQRNEKLENIVAIHLFQSKKTETADKLIAEVLTRDGSYVSGKLISLTEDILTLEGLNKYKIPFSEIAAIYFKNGRVVYLSDIKPSKVYENPNFIRAENPLESDLELPYKIDRCVYLKPLKIGKKVYRKGLGVHAYSMLEYKINGRYEKFTAEIGVDGCADGRGSVVFIIYGDTKQLFRSQVIKGKDAPKKIQIDIKGVKILKLIVDFADDHAIGDLANWADARLIKPPR